MGLVGVINGRHPEGIVLGEVIPSGDEGCRENGKDEAHTSSIFCSAKAWYLVASTDAIGGFYFVAQALEQKST